MKYKAIMALTYYKDVTVYADDIEEAQEKAIELCESWNNVQGAEVVDILDSDEL